MNPNTQRRIGLSRVTERMIRTRDVDGEKCVDLKWSRTGGWLGGLTPVVIAPADITMREISAALRARVVEVNDKNAVVTFTVHSTVNIFALRPHATANVDAKNFAPVFVCDNQVDTGAYYEPNGEVRLMAVGDLENSEIEAHYVLEKGASFTFAIPRNDWEYSAFVGVRLWGGQIDGGTPQPATIVLSPMGVTDGPWFGLDTIDRILMLGVFGAIDAGSEHLRGYDEEQTKKQNSNGYVVMYKTLTDMPNLNPAAKNGECQCDLCKAERSGDVGSVLGAVLAAIFSGGDDDAQKPTRDRTTH